MPIPLNRWTQLALLSLTALSPVAALACASCGCTLSSDWENIGIYSGSGFKLDLRYDYLNQNQLRSGAHTISSIDASKIINNGDPQEVEKYTKNDYLSIGLDYSPNKDWGIHLQLPFIHRSHSTLGTASDGTTPGNGGGQYDSNTSSMGDISIISRYQGFSPRHNYGILTGLKLPTGSHTETGASTDPTDPGNVQIDRGLQPGTGTTDLILGGYYLDTLSKNWDYFTQVTFQTALNSNDQFKAGDKLSFNVGLRYMRFTRILPQIQLNAEYLKHDTGNNADTISTGGTLLYLSPGFSIPVSKQMSVYGFVQLPIYQDLNGVQLAPRYIASAGARFSF